MRIAVDNTETIERLEPRSIERAPDGIALRLRRLECLAKRLTLKPRHREQAPVERSAIGSGTEIRSCP